MPFSRSLLALFEITAELGGRARYGLFRPDSSGCYCRFVRELSESRLRVGTRRAVLFVALAMVFLPLVDLARSRSTATLSVSWTVAVDEQVQTGGSSGGDLVEHGAPLLSRFASVELVMDYVEYDPTIRSASYLRRYELKVDESVEEILDNGDTYRLERGHDRLTMRIPLQEGQRLELADQVVVAEQGVNTITFVAPGDPGLVGDGLIAAVLAILVLLVGFFVRSRPRRAGSEPGLEVESLRAARPTMY